MPELGDDVEVLSSGNARRTLRTTIEGRDVVVRELRLHQVERWKAVELFEREARLLRRLDHPGLPEYLDAYRADDGPGMVMRVVREYIDGTTLDEFVANAPPDDRLNPDELERFPSDLLEVLAYLHDRRPPVVHRHVTPEHVVRDRDGSYRLVGLGTLQAKLQSATGGSTFVGRSGFMPPEQAMGRSVPASDLYSLGQTMLTLATGESPAASFDETRQSLLDERDDWSEGTRTFVASLIRSDPEARPRSAVEARRRFRHREQLEDLSGRWGALTVDLPPPEGVSVESTADGIDITLPANPDLAPWGLAGLALGIFGPAFFICLSTNSVAVGTCSLAVVVTVAFWWAAWTTIWRFSAPYRLSIDVSALRLPLTGRLLPGSGRTTLGGSISTGTIRHARAQRRRVFSISTPFGVDFLTAHDVELDCDEGTFHLKTTTTAGAADWLAEAIEWTSREGRR